MISCQNCGSKSSRDGQHCDHCGGKLSKFLCRKCFYPLPSTAAFCILCGTEQVHGFEEPILTELDCPHCAISYGFEHDQRVVKLETKPAVVGEEGDEVCLYYYECPKCHGNWLSEQVLLRMLEQSSRRRGNIEPEVRQRGIEDRSYFKCPKSECGEMLSRFLWTRVVSLRVSNISFPIVDRCSGCGGLWLDNGELDWLLEMGSKALPQPQNKNAGASASSKNPGNDWGMAAGPAARDSSTTETEHLPLIEIGLNLAVDAALEGGFGGGGGDGGGDGGGGD